MKKLILMLFALLIAVPATYADLNKTLNKKLEKEYKTKLKEFKKGKWELMGSRTMEVALLKHYIRLNDDTNDVREVMGTATAKSKNNAYQMASNNAVVKYASDCGSSLKGRVMSDVFANGTDTDGEFDHFFAAYERLVEKEIKGEMEESLTIFRKTPEGNTEINTYYTVSESKASKARMRALENALKESEAAQKYADKISEFVREGFKD